MKQKILSISALVGNPVENANGQKFLSPKVPITQNLEKHVKTAQTSTEETSIDSLVLPFFNFSISYLLFEKFRFLDSGSILKSILAVKKYFGYWALSMSFGVPSSDKGTRKLPLLPDNMEKMPKPAKKW